jgi:hypothetical protein
LDLAQKDEEVFHDILLEMDDMSEADARDEFADDLKQEKKQ